MPNKSKRNRRATARIRRETINTSVAGNEMDAPMANTQPGKITPSYSNPTRVTASAYSIHFIDELKWIGVAAGSVIILLIIAYFLFH